MTADILVLTSDPNALTALVCALQAEALVPLLVGGMADALEYLEAETPLAILMHDPKSDDDVRDFCVAVRNQTRLALLPIVVLGHSEISNFLAMGADYFFSYLGNETEIAERVRIWTLAQKNRASEALTLSPRSVELQPTLSDRLEQVKDLVPRVREGDYFSILGVDENATDEEIQERYVALSKDLDPSVFDAMPESKQDAEDVLEILAEAREILLSPRLRPRYQRNLVPKESAS